jgi:hypothetical protein
MLGSNCSKEKNFFAGKRKIIAFEREYSVSGEFVDVDSIGVRRITVSGQYLILRMGQLPYFFKIYDLKDLSFIGDFGYKGQGPDDFRRVTAIRNKGYPYIEVEDWGLKQVRILDLEKLAETNRVVASKVLSYSEIAKTGTVFRTFYVNDTCMLVKVMLTPWEDDTKFSYVQYNPLSGKSIKTFKLYNYPVTQNMSNEILTLADCMKPDGSKIACHTGILDQIDILDINNPDNNVSITLNNYSLDYPHEKPLEDSLTGLKMFYMSFPICTNDLIFVLYNNHQSRKFEIHVIDWNGKPVCKLVLDRILDSIEFDEEQGVIYGLEMETTQTYKYNIKQYLSK